MRALAYSVAPMTRDPSAVPAIVAAVAARRVRPVPRVIHETVAGETVIIHMETGRYYSLNACGSFVWNALVDGRSVGAVTDACVLAAPGHAATVAESVARFVDALTAENLVEAEAPAAAETPAAAAPSWLALAPPSVTFEPPAMEIFTDMERLLPLDPLHEVDERGWPYRRSDES